MNWDYWKKWAAAAAIRGIRTFAEGVLVYIGGDAVAVGKLIITDINWGAALAAGAMGFVISVLLALKGLPEVKPEDLEPEEEDDEDTL